MPLDQVLDHNNDRSSVVLLMDLEQAFSRAGEVLTPTQIDQLSQFKGVFDVDVTLGPVAKIVRQAEPEHGITRRELTGKPIQINGHSPVNGAGVSIRLNVRSR